MEFECARDILDTVPMVMQVMRTTMRSAAKEQLTVPQFRVLVKLGKGCCSNTELAEWIGNSEAAMSRMVDGLVKKGLVTRDAESRDRRQVKLSLTPKGRSEYTKIREKGAQELSHHLDALSPREKNELKQGLALLRKVFL